MNPSLSLRCIRVAVLECFVNSALSGDFLKKNLSLLNYGHINSWNFEYFFLFSAEEYLAKRQKLNDLAR